MKNYFKLFALLISTLTFTACGGDDDPTPGPTPDPTESISQTACSISENEEVDAYETKEITINYSTAINLNASANITLNGTKVSAKKANTSRPGIVIAVDLASGTDYTLIVPSGTVLGATDASRTAKAFTLHFKTIKEATPDLPDNDAMKVTRMIGFGWNLGNHFDSTESDANKQVLDFTDLKSGYWDHAKPTKELYTKLAAAGIKTVRIPATWGNHQINDDNYTIKADYMAEVKENVLMAKEAGLNVVLNTHHDEYWQDAYAASTNSLTNEQIKTRLTATWKQIAEAFKGEGDYLILETFNELNHNWAAATPGELRIQNEWNQLVVDIIRGTGGNNATRWIAVPSYQAAPKYALTSDFVIPTDKANKIIVAIHCYDPYDFTLANPLAEAWGHNAGNSWDESNITDLFKKIKAQYIDKNIPIYLGEMGCSNHGTALGKKCRDYYLEYFCRAAYYHGLACCLWDNYNPGTGSEHHAYFNHNNGAWEDGTESIVKTMVRATTSDDASYTLQSIYAKAPKK